MITITTHTMYWRTRDVKARKRRWAVVLYFADLEDRVNATVGRGTCQRGVWTARSVTDPTFKYNAPLSVPTINARGFTEPSSPVKGALCRLLVYCWPLMHHWVQNGHRASTGPKVTEPRPLLFCASCPKKKSIIHFFKKLCNFKQGYFQQGLW